MTIKDAPIRRLNVVGCGRVGKTLARLWSQSGALMVQDVLNPSASSAANAVEFIGAGRAVTDMADLRPADTYLIAAPDALLQPIATQLAERCAAVPHAIALHCSGALGADVLAPLRACGWSVASAHPVMSFADPASAAKQFQGTPCGVEGDAEAVAEATRALVHVGAECFGVEPAHKRLYHAAAVYSSNFLPVLQAVAIELWEHSGVPPELTRHLMERLMRNAVDNISAFGPAAALTGPAARGDSAVVAAQTQAIQDWDPLAGEAYGALSALAMRLAKTGKVGTREDTQC
ncbi:Rossmann-like and DUF2520 domain-containing protein [Lampropedia aestuarii]|uniref:Rossmann-like and DUF2520 domain-containing protein n=1 Tax=Lampropedia aestuarii TaxID=2562762 RepID=UPI001F0D9C79|nr:Rossmann-like and DUF2520 domain-containing protein [Lampropedia aestuarii]